MPWMQQVKKETGMLTATEVATPEHVELALKYGIDVLWVGARTTANPFAMQALADALKGTDVPVLVKNPTNPDLELWIGALERLNLAGIKRLGAIHRGFSSYDNKIYRNLPTWQIPIELHRRIPDLPIVNDPSHIGGRRELIAPLCQQAMDLGFDGLIVESHCDPDKAWSDAKQQVTPDVLDYILSLLVIRDETVTTEGIVQLRKQIDEIDNSLIELLAKRQKAVAGALADTDVVGWYRGEVKSCFTVLHYVGGELAAKDFRVLDTPMEEDREATLSALVAQFYVGRGQLPARWSSSRTWSGF